MGLTNLFTRCVVSATRGWALGARFARRRRFLIAASRDWQTCHNSADAIKALQDTRCKRGRRPGRGNFTQVFVTYKFGTIFGELRAKMS